MHFNIIPHFFGLSIVFLKKMKKIPKKYFSTNLYNFGQNEKMLPDRGAFSHIFEAFYAPKISAIRGAISAGRKIAGKRFAVLTLLMPSRFIPINIIMSEPVVDM